MRVNENVNSQSSSLKSIHYTTLNHRLWSSLDQSFKINVYLSPVHVSTVWDLSTTIAQPCVDVVNYGRSWRLVDWTCRTTGNWGWVIYDNRLFVIAFKGRVGQSLSPETKSENESERTSKALHFDAEHVVVGPMVEVLHSIQVW